MAASALNITNHASYEIFIQVYTVTPDAREDVLQNWKCWDIGWEKFEIFSAYVPNGEQINIGGIDEGSISKEQHICIITSRHGYPAAYKGTSYVLQKNPDCKVAIYESNDNDIKTENCKVD